MRQKKLKISVKRQLDFSLKERKLIVEEYLKSGLSKVAIWYKYTGSRNEHGVILKWMRNLGYNIPSIKCKFAKTNPHIMIENKNKVNDNNIADLQERIKQLEQALVQSELRATAFETMIEVAEKELKINIKKKSYTKPLVR